jgi:hypothetical protein
MCQDDGATCMAATCGLGNPCVNFAMEAELPVSLGSLAEDLGARFHDHEAVAGQDSTATAI